LTKVKLLSNRIKVKATVSNGTVTGAKSTSITHIFLRFEGWNIIESEFSPVNPDTEVQCITKGMLGTQILAATNTDTQGNATFELEHGSSGEDDLDIFFIVKCGGTKLHGVEIKNDLSTEDIKDINEKSGYYENFDGRNLGTKDNPLIFRIKPLLIYLKFEAWDEVKEKYLPLPNEIDVQVIDYDALSSNEVLMSVKTSEGGLAVFAVVDKRALDEAEPDLYFLVKTANKTIRGAKYDNDWSSMDWRTTDRKRVGYIDDYKKSILGEPNDPLVFRLFPYDIGSIEEIYNKCLDRITPWHDLRKIQCYKEVTNDKWREIGTAQKNLYLIQLLKRYSKRPLGYFNAIIQQSTAEFPDGMDGAPDFKFNDDNNIFMLEAVTEYFLNYDDPFKSASYDINKIIAINGGYIAIGCGGVILTSADGMTWTNAESNVGQPLRDIAINDDLIVVVGYYGVIRTSDNQRIWTERSSGTKQTLNSIVYRANRFIAVGDGGQIVSSTNGHNWQTTVSNTTNTLNRIIHANNRFIAVGTAGTIVSSDNGVNWVVRNSNTQSSLNDLIFVSGRFIAAGDNGTIIVSVNGESWAAPAWPSATIIPTGSLNKIAYRTTSSGNVAVIVGNDGVIVTLNIAGDGVISPASRHSDTNQSLHGVTTSDSHFIAVGSNGTILTSNDAESWTVQDSITEFTLLDVIDDGGTVVAVGCSGTILRSTDHETWNDVCFGAADRDSTTTANWNTVDIISPVIESKGQINITQNNAAFDGIGQEYYRRVTVGATNISNNVNQYDILYINDDTNKNRSKKYLILRRANSELTIEGVPQLGQNADATNPDKMWTIEQGPRLVLVDAFGFRINGKGATVNYSKGFSTIQLPADADLSKVNEKFDTIYVEEARGTKVHRILSFNNISKQIIVAGYLHFGSKSSAWQIPGGVSGSMPNDNWVTYGPGQNLGYDHCDGMLFVIWRGEIINKHRWTSFSSFENIRNPPIGSNYTPAFASAIRGNKKYSFYSIDGGNDYRKYAFGVYDYQSAYAAIAGAQKARFYFKSPESGGGFNFMVKDDSTNGWPGGAGAGKDGIMIHDGKGNYHIESAGCIVSHHINHLKGDLIEALGNNQIFQQVKIGNELLSDKLNGIRDESLVYSSNNANSYWQHKLGGVMYLVRPDEKPLDEKPSDQNA
jgi:hypothetical protein